VVVDRILSDRQGIFQYPGAKEQRNYGTDLTPLHSTEDENAGIDTEQGCNDSDRLSAQCNKASQNNNISKETHQGYGQIPISPCLSTSRTNPKAVGILSLVPVVHPR
jgi:hypothetical protein